MRLSALFVVCASFFQLSAAVLVTNGMFNTDCSGWVTTNTDGSFCQVGGGQTLGAGNPGGWAELNNGPSVIPTMSQLIAGLSIGTMYTLSWDMQSGFHCCGNPAQPGVSVAIDGNNYLFTVLNSDTWHSFSRTFTYTGTSNNLVFSSQLNSTDQDAGFDNIAINAAASGVPEPSTLVLMGAGIAAILLRRKR
jgi:hypothetical protein